MDINEIFKSAYKSAIKGDINDQYRIGLGFYRGFGITINLRQAIYWLEKSANQGQILSISCLYNIYLKGDTIKRNISKAFYWKRKYINCYYPKLKCKIPFYILFP
jgi:TPR repeat protein